MQYDKETFEAAARPLIQWLNENTNPHAQVIVTVDSAELLTAEIIVKTQDYIKD